MSAEEGQTLHSRATHRDLDEGGLIASLREGNEDAFATLVERYHGAMIRVARGFVRDEATAEEVVQDAWLGVLNGLAAFEGRSSIRSWIFAIVVNRAKTRGAREARSVPFSALAANEAAGSEPAVSPDRFLDATARWPGHWAQPPLSWGENPEARLMRTETMSQLARALDELPPGQRMVISLRDVAGHDAATICNALGITETNMRVLLHRARSKVRGTLERYLKDAGQAAKS